MASQNSRSNNEQNSTNTATSLQTWSYSDQNNSNNSNKNNNNNNNSNNNDNNNNNNNNNNNTNNNINNSKENENVVKILQLQERLINSEVELFNSYQTNLTNIITLHSQDMTIIQKLMNQMSLFVDERQKQIQETQNVLDGQFRKHQELSERHKVTLDALAISAGVITDNKAQIIDTVEVTKDSTDSKALSESVTAKIATIPKICPTPERSTGIVYDFAMSKHKCICGQAHSEHPGRLTAIWTHLHERNMISKCQRVKARKASHQELLLVHKEEHIQMFTTTTPKRSPATTPGKDVLITLQCKGVGLGDHMGTFWNYEASPAVARLACGSVIDLSLEVAAGRIQNGIALIRPPGHHARHNQAMGGCFFNNIAVATKVLLSLATIERVMILDLDLHHGNGLQEIFYGSNKVLVISIHKHTYKNEFPYSGGSDELGEGDGVGYNINVGWETKDRDKIFRHGDPEYLLALRTILLPIALDFRPDIILVAMGFGAAEATYAQINEAISVTAECFSYIIKQLMSISQGKIVLSLEGGSEPAALTICSELCLAALLGMKLHEMPDASVSKKPIANAVYKIQNLVKKLSNNWPTMLRMAKYINMSDSEFKMEDIK